MLLSPCILQYIIHFPGSGRSSGDHWMLPRPCFLQYIIINFTGSQRSARRLLDAAQTVYFTIYYQLPRISVELRRPLDAAQAVYFTIYY